MENEHTIKAENPSYSITLVVNEPHARAFYIAEPKIATALLKNCINSYLGDLVACGQYGTPMIRQIVQINLDVNERKRKLVDETEITDIITN